jgi:hypothetical protein
MWELLNQTPFAAERTWVRDQHGRHQWIVVVKATYDVTASGELMLSEAAVDPLLAPEYIGEPGESSLRYDADLVAMKPATDVYLNATAFAPADKPRTQFTVSFQLDSKRKDLCVFGPRVWTRSITGGVKPSSPEPFRTLDITYERAFGGFDRSDVTPTHQRIRHRNPVGSGVVRGPSLVGTPAPSIEAPSEEAGRGWPAGFGALASHWSPRRELAGTYDDAWVEKRKPLLPLDYDPKWLLCSPLDQRVRGYLKGGERVALTNLTLGGYLAFEVPSERIQFQTHFGSRQQDHDAKLVSLIIESKRPRVIAVWQTSLDCHSDAEYLDAKIIKRLEYS